MPSDVHFALMRSAKEEGLSLDKSFITRADDYLSTIANSTRPELVHLNERNRIIILATVSQRALIEVRRAQRSTATINDFNRALYEFKGFTPPPTDTCEEAAVRIAGDLDKHTAELRKSVRRSFSL